MIEKSKGFFKKGIEMMKNCDKRILMATISEEYGYGGDTRVSEEFNVRVASWPLVPRVQQWCLSVRPS